MLDQKKADKAHVSDFEAVVQADSETADLEATAAQPVTRAAVAGLLGAGARRSLAVGSADDPVEHEADAVAARVVAHLRGDGAAPGSGVHAGHDHVARSAEGTVGAEGGGLSPQAEAALSGARGGGAPLPAAMRGAMESAMGADFGGVRVHTGGTAKALNEGMQASAFTLGNDVFFRDGLPDATSAGGQALLAHELTHVVQQGSTVARSMWTVSDFEKATNEGTFVRKGDAQNEIIKMIKDYKVLEGKRGLVPKEKTHEALRLAENMRDASAMWLKAHTQGDVKDGSRLKRRAGFEKFQLFLVGEEIPLLQSDLLTNDKKTPDVAPSDHKGFIKLQKKYDDTGATTLFQDLGRLADKVASSDGQSTEFEVEVSFPCDPSGIAYVGGRILGSIERDDGNTKVRAELVVTAGANIPGGFAKVGAELGGYIESQAKSGSDAMELVSYAFYRRFRESSLIPDEAANYIWGGKTNAFGKAKAEAWSLAVERKMFAIPDPDEEELHKKFPDPLKFAAALEKEKKEVEEKRDAIYVESGGILAFKAKFTAGIVKAKVGVTGNTGRRVDYTSLEARKGGAGKENQLSDSIFALGATQKSTGRSVHGLTVAGEVEAKFPGIGSVGGAAQLKLGWVSNGAHADKTKNKGNVEPETTLKDVSFSVTMNGQLDLAKLAGPAGDMFVNQLAKRLTDFVHEQAAPQFKAQEPTTGSEALDAVQMEIAMVRQGLPESGKESLLEQAGLESSGGTGVQLTLTFTKGKPITLDIKKLSTKGLEGGPLEVSLKRSQRIVRIVFDKTVTYQ